ncbi:RecQ family ATP-dependent DNA helicase [Sphingobacterium hungaricum]
MITKEAILKQFWGYDAFRPLQDEIIDSILAGQDTLALMPTGGGKSICFQVPALMKEGICIVVSPLIALMKDQVEHLRQRNIPAIAIYSGMKPREVDIALDNCIFGNIKFLYLSPERLYSELVKERIRHMNVNLFAIDEAHCISQWGYDFRPPYLQLAQLRELHAEVPFLALTATATARVVDDIQLQLAFKKQNVFKKSFRRPNLAYMALHEEDKMGRLLRLIKKLGGTGIVYVRNRRETQEVTQYLFNHGIPSDFYHAGLSMEERSSKQEAWFANVTRVIVATNAFGMGIDKSDVRFVVHLDVPDSLEAYYQEAGRAGRDEKKAYPVLLYQQADRERLWENVQASFPDTDFIKKVYHHLGSYFQIAYGSGKGVALDFDLVAFCKKYALEIIPTLSALKFLEKDGWLTVSDAIYIPSRFKFEVEFSEVYKLQVQSAKFDPLIKAILRTHGGIYDLFVPINEYEIAKKLKTSYGQVVEMIQQLVTQGYASYLPKTNSPQIEYLHERVSIDHLSVDHTFIQNRKKIKEEQVRAVYQYLDAKTCRSISLQSYFGEQDDTYCEVCDLCLIRAHSDKEDKKIRAEIKYILVEKSLPLKELMDQMTIGDDASKLKIIRKLLDEEKITLKNDLYSWVVPF